MSSHADDVIVALGKENSPKSTAFSFTLFSAPRWAVAGYNYYLDETEVDVYVIKEHVE